MLVLTGPTSLMSRLSDSGNHDDDGHLASPMMASRDSVSDTELDRLGTTNHRIERTRHTVSSQVLHYVIVWLID